MASNQSDIQITRYWSVDEVAQSFGCHANTVRRWVASGLLPALKVGGLIRIAESEVQAFIQRARVTAQEQEV